MGSDSKSERHTRRSGSWRVWRRSTRPAAIDDGGDNAGVYFVQFDLAYTPGGRPDLLTHVDIKDKRK
eukprot:352433-Amphidinium_carterae.2